MTTKARAEKSPPVKGQLRLDSTDGIAGEAWLEMRLHHWHGVPVGEVTGHGEMTPDERKRRMHEAIERHGLEWVICGKDSETRKAITYGEAYRRLYGEKF